MELFATLQAATEGLTYLSESDAPLTPFFWPQAELGPSLDPSALLAKLQRDPPPPVREVETAAFYAPMLTLEKWATEEDKATVARYTTLLETLERLLTGVRTFRLGVGPEFEVYTVGQTARGDWAGLKTQLTET